jgi:hypothetical protein
VRERARPRHLPRTPGTAFALHSVGILGPTSPSLAHSRLRISLAGILGGGALCPITLSHALPVPCLLSHLVGILVVVPCARSPSLVHSWRRAPARPLLRTPSTMCPLTLSLALPMPLRPLAPPMHSWRRVCFRAQLGSLVVAPCAHPHPLSHTPAPCQCKRAAQAKGSQPARGTHLCSSAARGTGQDSER